MFKKLFTSLLIALFFLPNIAWGLNFDANQFKAVIEARNNVEQEKNIIFDASQSVLPTEDAPVRFSWDFGDGSRPEPGEEVVHSFAEPGEYTVTLTVTQNRNETTTEHQIFVYDKLVLLITDATNEQVRIEKLITDAKEGGVLVDLIANFEEETAFLNEEVLAGKLAEKATSINNATAIVSWTRGATGMNAITRLVRERSEIQEFLQSKTLVVITEDNLARLGRILQSSYDIIQPQQIVITRRFELKSLIQSESPEAFIEELKKGISEYQIINTESGRVSIFNSISHLVNFMIVRGVPSNTIILILMLPVIATIITFIKQVIGINTFGIYTTSIITLSFLALGLKFGLTILILIILAGTILRKALDHLRLLYTPRIAIILSISALILLLVLAMAIFLDVSQVATIAVFPMLIMTTLAEKFVSAMSGRGYYGAVLLMAETTIVSLLCYSVVELDYLRNLVLATPELILLLILANLLLGRWTGLRVMEYFRFREVMKHAEE